MYTYRQYVYIYIHITFIYDYILLTACSPGLPPEIIQIIRAQEIQEMC